jgi:hypothetical protein
MFKMPLSRWNWMQAGEQNVAKIKNEEVLLPDSNLVFNDLE